MLDLLSFYGLSRISLNTPSKNPFPSPVKPQSRSCHPFPHCHIAIPEDPQEEYICYLSSVMHLHIAVARSYHTAASPARLQSV